MEKFLISLSVALIVGLLFSRVAKKLNLPAVTAYLIAGIFIGPFMLGGFGIQGLGFYSEDYISQFSIISKLALGFIAFSIGNEFRVSDLKSMGRQAIIIGILQAVITTAVVDIALVLLHFARPDMLSLGSALILGAIAAATAPAATLMVVRQYKAHGPLTKLLLMVVAIDDAVGLVLFSLSFGIASAIEAGAVSVVSVAVEPAIEIMFSVLLGVTAGEVLTFLEKFFHSRSKRLSLVVGFVMLVCGLSMLEFEAEGVHIGFSLLLVCMITGTVFCNFCSASNEIMDRMDRWTAPINILFFVISGAELNLLVIRNVYVLAIGIVYIAFRSLGKIYGAYLSSHMTGCSDKIQKYLGITLLPQAGVALGMANSSLVFSEGLVICNIVLFSVLVYELVGPTLTRISLFRAGEIDTEGRKSSRVVNS